MVSIRYFLLPNAYFLLFSNQMAPKNKKFSKTKRGLLGVQKRVERPYQRAVEWMRAPHERRQSLSRSMASDWRRIADLGSMGAELDALRAPYYLVRWVAAPGRARAAMRNARFESARDQLRDGPWSREKWRRVRHVTQAIVGPEKLPTPQLASADEEGFAALLSLLAA